MRLRLRAATLALLVLGCRRPDDASWDLVNHFSVARSGSEPALIDVGTVGARRYLVSGWSVDESAGGMTFVWGTGEESVVEFYLAAARDLELTFRCMPFRFEGAPPQTISFHLNGVEGPRTTLGDGLAEYRVVTSRSAAKEGWNRLVVRYAYARAPSEFGNSSDARRLAVAWDFIRFGVEGGVAGAESSTDSALSQLLIPTGASASYPVRLPPRATLRIDELAFAGIAGATLAIRLEADGKPPTVVARFDGTRAVRDVRVPMPWSGIVRLSLEVRGGGPTTLARLARPRLATEASRSESTARTVPAARPPNVVIYLVDTLRADRLGCYGYGRPTSPYLDAFARDAVLFTDAITEAPWTRPAVASLFTGLPARRHGVNGRADVLPDEAVTMAEVLKESGYETAAFVTNGNIAPAYGFAQGFDVFDLLPGTVVPGSDASVPAPLPPPPASDSVTRAAVAWLDARTSQRPFLLYLHTADPHGPYIASPEFRARVEAPEDSDLGSLASLRLLEEGKVRIDAGTVRSVSALYEAEVARNDEEFGKVIAALRARGLFDESLIVFVADHGEELYDHRGWQHGRTLYEEVEHVPLVVKRPGGKGAGTQIEHTVQLGDVLPTLLRYVATAPAPALPGTDLFRPAGDADQSTALAHLDLDGRFGDAIIEGGWKLIAMSDGFALFDRAADPGDQRDLSKDRPVTVDFLRARLSERLASASRLYTARSARVTDDVRRNLRALGYVE